MDGIRESFRRQGLVRPTQSRVIAGVCAGVGRRLGLDPWLTRLLFILTLILLPGSQILIYPILWFLMPAEGWAPYRPAGSEYPGPPQA